MSEDNARSIEYTFLTLEIFKASDEDLALQLELHSLLEVDPESLYVGDVTYGEWEFLLLKEVDFRLTCKSESQQFFQAQLIEQLERTVL